MKAAIQGWYPRKANTFFPWAPPQGPLTEPWQPIPENQSPQTCPAQQIPRWLLLIGIKPAAAHSCSLYSPSLALLFLWTPKGPHVVSGNEERRLSVLSEKDHLSWECEKGALGITESKKSAIVINPTFHFFKWNVFFKLHFIVVFRSWWVCVLGIALGSVSNQF